jgi:hypothetical protein
MNNWNTDTDMLIIDVEGDTPRTEAYSWERVREIVGGFVEILPLSEGLYIMVNEEGRLQDLPLNPLVAWQGQPLHRLHGAVVVVSGHLILV